MSDKLCDKLHQTIERTGTKGKHAIGSGELEKAAGPDGHGPRQSGKFVKPPKIKATKSAY